MRRGCGALQALRVVVRHLRDLPGHGQCFVRAPGEQSRRGNAHRCPVAIAAVRPPVARLEPPAEHSAVSPVRIAAAPVVERFGGMNAMQQRIGHRDRANRVVRKVGARAEKRKLLRPVVMELVDRADDVADDRAEHGAIDGDEVMSLSLVMR